VKVADLTKAAKALKMPIDHLEQPCGYFSVFDGHQGDQCSGYISKNFHVKLLKRLSADTDTASWTDERFSSCLTEICEELDTEFLAKFRTALDGSTLVVALITGQRIFTAWVGDSQAILCQRAEYDQLLASTITEDHRPSLESEAKRVADAGGVVVNFGMAYRVAHNGYEEKMREIRRGQALGLGMVSKEPVALAVSRALGDRDFKAVTGKALLIATPGVTCIKIDRTHKFLALVCDGVTDVMSAVEVCDELDKQRPGPPDPVARARIACGALVQEAYRAGSEDNITVILVKFDWDGGYLEAPLPADHPAAIQMREAEKQAEKGDSRAVASKKRRLEAASSISKQKVAAYERALSAEQVAASSKVAAATPAAAAAPTAEAEVAEPAAAEKAEETKEADGEEDDESMTFL